MSDFNPYELGAAEVFDAARKSRYGVDSSEPARDAILSLASTIDLRTLFNPKTGEVRPLMYQAKSPLTELRSMCHDEDLERRTLRMIATYLDHIPREIEDVARRYILSTLDLPARARASIWWRDGRRRPSDAAASTRVTHGYALFAKPKRLTIAGVLLYDRDSEDPRFLLPPCPLWSSDTQEEILYGWIRCAILELTAHALTVLIEKDALVDKSKAEEPPPVAVLRAISRAMLTDEKDRYWREGTKWPYFDLALDSNAESIAGKILLMCSDLDSRSSGSFRYNQLLKPLTSALEYRGGPMCDPIGKSTRSFAALNGLIKRRILARVGLESSEPVELVAAVERLIDSTNVLDQSFNLTRSLRHDEPHT